MKYLLILLILSLFQTVFCQDSSANKLSFYSSIIFEDFDSLKEIIKNRINEQHSKNEYLDLVIVNGLKIDIDYNDTISINTFKKIIDSIKIKTITLRKKDNTLKGSILINTLEKPEPTHSRLNITTTGISAYTPSITRVEMYIRDFQGKLIKEISKTGPSCSRLFIKEMTYDFIGKNNILVMCTRDANGIETTFYKN